MMYKRWIALLFIANGLYSLSYANSYELNGKHAELALECEACHNTATPIRRAPASSCIHCHGDYPEIAQITNLVQPNPHNSHQGEIRCTVCHKSHEPSVLYCNSCHSFELKME